MPIKVKAIESIPFVEDAGKQVDKVYAGLQIFDAAGNCVAAPRVPIEDMPSGIQVGDFVAIVKAG